jgi:murein DD-endopeptidase MepM/ murein hydrolase activator NlpD
MNYTVRNRDTLTSIANKLGTSVDDLAAANGLTNPNHIQVGQQLNVPGDQDEFTHSVTATVSGVSSRPTPTPVTGTNLAAIQAGQPPPVQQPSYLKQLISSPKATIAATVNHARGLPAAGEAAPTTAGQNAVHVNTPYYLQTQGGHGFTPGPRQCFAAASAMARAAGGHVSSPANRIEIATHKDKSGTITVNPQKAAQGRAHIDSELDAGRPVVVGVAHNHGRYNVDKMTDHFVTITGRGTDAQGRAYYTFNDPGTRSGQDTNTRDRFYVDPKTGGLYRPSNPLGVGLQSQRYQVTMVR